MNKDRRKYIRSDFEVDLFYSIDSFNWYKGRSRNISRGGIFIEGLIPGETGIKIFVKIKLDESKVFEIPGRIVWQNQADKNPVGMGVSFLSELSSDIWS